MRVKKYLSKSDHLRQKLAEVFDVITIDRIKKSSYKILPDKIIVTLNEFAPLTDVVCDKLKDLMGLVYGCSEVIFLGDRICLPYHKPDIPHQIWLIF
jgi:hypothetical protein